MVELNFQENLPELLLILFSVNTVILISVHLVALMVSTCLLPVIESSLNQLPFARPDPTEIRRDSKSYHVPPYLTSMKLQLYVEIAWIFSTLLGTLLLLVEVPLVAWVQFYKLSKRAAIAASGIILFFLALLVGFAVHFYRLLADCKYQEATQRIVELQHMATSLDMPTEEVFIPTELTNQIDLRKDSPSPMVPPWALKAPPS